MPGERSDLRSATHFHCVTATDPYLPLHRLSGRRKSLPQSSWQDSCEAASCAECAHHTVCAHGKHCCRTTFSSDYMLAPHTWKLLGDDFCVRHSATGLPCVSVRVCVRGLLSQFGAGGGHLPPLLEVGCTDRWHIVYATGVGCPPFATYVLEIEVVRTSLFAQNAGVRPQRLFTQLWCK